MRVALAAVLGCLTLVSARREKRLFGIEVLVTSTSSSTTQAATKTTAVSEEETVYATATITQTVAAARPTSKQKAVENTFWKSFKARGVNLGNWLVLEEWMDTAYYAQYSSSGTDEWTFCETLGAEQCTEVLTQHWNDWVQQTDISQLAALGYNLLRIPIGHWALIATTSEEPYVHATQMDQVTRVMQYASQMGMYVVLDIHGLPGSQNGKEHSGHAGSIDWFTDDNQKRSLTTVTAAMNYIYASPYKDVIAALEICNEPNITTSKHRKTYESYIKSAKKIIHSVNASMPIMFHDGFLGADEWSSFTKNAKDNYVLDLHEYFTGLTSNSVTSVKDVCTLATAQSKTKSKTPVFVGEFSVSVGGVYLDTDAWRQEFYETQVKQFSGTNMAGSAFWNFKTFNTGSNTTQNNGWSVQALAAAGSVSTDTWTVANALTCPATK